MRIVIVALVAAFCSSSTAFRFAARVPQHLRAAFAKNNKAETTPPPPTPSANTKTGTEDQKLKKQALELLDCLTSPRDLEDPQYDVSKDMRRDEVLRSNDYSALKVALRERGLRTSGD